MIVCLGILLALLGRRGECRWSHPTIVTPVDRQIPNRMWDRFRPK